MLCPGETTTATLLYHCLHPHQGTINQAVFTDIGPALLRGDADLGVLIHEGRLTYQRDGLTLVEDLGTSFERLARCAGAAGRDPGATRALPDGVAAEFARLLRESIAYGWANRDEALVTIRRHAQEMDEERDLALRRAVRERPHRRPRRRGRARARGARANGPRGGRCLPEDLPPLTVVG